MPVFVLQFGALPIADASTGRGADGASITALVFADDPTAAVHAALRAAAALGWRSGDDAEDHAAFSLRTVRRHDLGGDPWWLALHDRAMSEGLALHVAPWSLETRATTAEPRPARRRRPSDDR